MVANIDKIKMCFRALGMFIKNVFTLKLPLWLCIVVGLVCVLFSLLVACSHERMSTQALVGHTEYQDHSYLVFRALDDQRTLAVVHDPDCMCKFVEVVPDDIVE